MNSTNIFPKSRDRIRRTTTGNSRRQQAGPPFPFRLTVLMLAGLLLSGCAGPGTGTTPLPGTIPTATDPAERTVVIQGLVLPSGVILVTKAPEFPGIEKDLLMVHVPGNKERIPGSIMEFEIRDQIAESYPPQAQGLSQKVISETSPVIEIPMDHAPRIKMHLAEGGHLVDVRDPEEFSQGHLSDAVNIPKRDMEGAAINLEWDYAVPVLVYGRDGAQADAASRWFKNEGYEIVLNFGSMGEYTGDLE